MGCFGIVHIIFIVTHELQILKTEKYRFRKIIVAILTRHGAGRIAIFGSFTQGEAWP